MGTMTSTQPDRIRDRVPSKSKRTTRAPSAVTPGRTHSIIHRPPPGPASGDPFSHGRTGARACCPKGPAVLFVAMAEVRWGLIGCGDIVGRRVASALRSAPGSLLVAVSRRRAELAEEAARLFEARRAHASWSDLLRDDEVDAVYIATPVHLHAEMAIAAAEAGKHVL